MKQETPQTAEAKIKELRQQVHRIRARRLRSQKGKLVKRMRRIRRRLRAELGANNV